MSIQNCFNMNESLRNFWKEQDWELWMKNFDACDYKVHKHVIIEHEEHTEDLIISKTFKCFGFFFGSAKKIILRLLILKSAFQGIFWERIILNYL